MNTIIRNITCLLFTCLLFSFNSAQAQEKIVIRGIVTSVSDKSPIPGVVVSELAKDGRIINSVPTDMNGNYAIKVSSLNNSLQFQIIGTKSKLEPINNRKSIDIALEDDSKTLEEVVVEAKSKVNTNGLTIDEKDITQSYQKISTKDMEGVASASIDDALQGRLAGVDISASSGDPGAGMQVRIRGAASLNANVTPLVVVDGIIFETTISSDFSFATADEDQYASMLSIAPSDIKDITVLTDAASTAQWGTAGANGVLLISTKRGEKGKPKITYNYKGTVSFKPKSIPMLNGNQYSELIPEEYMNAYGIPLDATSRKEFQYDPNDPWWYHNYSNSTNWINEISQNGYTQEHTLSLSGGDKARYYMSVGYDNQTGITIGTGYQRINARVNLDYNISDRLKVSTSFSYSHGLTKKNYFTDVREQAYTRMPNMSVYEFNEEGVNTGLYLSPLATPTGSNTSGNAQGAFSMSKLSATECAYNYNVVAMVKDGYWNLYNDRITPNFTLDYNLGNGFYFKGILAFDISGDKTAKFLPQSATGVASTSIYSNMSVRGESDYFSVQTQSVLSYSKKIGKFQDISLALSEGSVDARTPSVSAVNYNSPSSTLSNASVNSYTSSVASGNSISKTFRTSFAGQYKLLDRYIINAGLTREGNSKLSKNYRFGYFPTFSAKWQIMNEPFMKRLDKILDQLSVKASIARSGNLNFKTQTASTYGTYSYSYIDATGTYQTQPELSNLKWEKILAKNIALEMVFRNGTTLTLEAYSKKTSDVLDASEDTPTTSGYSTLPDNVGVIEFKGWSMLFKTTIWKGKKGAFTFDFNIAKDQNRWKKLSEYSATADETSTTTIVNGAYKVYQLVDRPLGGFYGYKFKGVYVNDAATIAKDKNGNPIYDAAGNTVNTRFNYTKTNPGYAFQGGDAIYEDINHDGNINYMDVVYLGNSNPLFYGGFNLGFRYGEFNLGLYFYYKYKFDLINSTKISLEAMNGYNNQSGAVLRRWRNPGDVTNIPRAVYGNPYNSLASDRYVEDGSFLRLKSLTVGYTPVSLAKKIGCSSIRFWATSSNLWTLTKYLGQDPEQTLLSKNYYVGYDASKTPRAIDFNFGLTLGF